MNLYLDINGVYYGTQADAKKYAPKLGRHSDGFEPVEVPTDKAGLIAYLNSITQGNHPTDTIVEEVTGAKPLGEIAPMHEPIERHASPMVERVAHSINVEEEIGRADARTAQRLMEHCAARLVEHIEGRA